MLHASRDPGAYTVLAEDATALIGLAIAAAGIGASQILKRSEIDGAAAILIGARLAGVVALLIRESRGLLIGEGIKPETAAAIRGIAASQAKVRSADSVLSMNDGPTMPW